MRTANRARPWTARERAIAPEAPLPTIRGVAVALPEHRYGQRELLEGLKGRWGERHKSLARLESFYGSVGVEQRCLALPMEEYPAVMTSFGAKNDAYIRVGAELGARAVRDAVAAAGLALDDVGAIFFTTVTGLAVPTIDARLVNVLRLRPSIRRVPLFGLGCVGGAAGLARTADDLRAHPEDVAVLLSVELCSLTLQDNLSVANFVAAALFGDGAAAVVLGGGSAAAPANDTHRDAMLAPRVVASRSAFFYDTERVMGWDIGEEGFRVVLSADVAAVAHAQLPDAVDSFLGDHGLARADVRRWICHPGGPKVIAAIEESLGLPPDALAITRRSLSTVGNLSSASVLHVLADTIPLAERGDVGLLMAMGPGFCAEMVLLEW